MKRIENNRGITLIALVVTIIVLIILAGISISALTNENGIIKEAKDAKNATEQAQIQEEIELATIQALKNNNNTPSDMQKYLESKFTDIEIYKTTKTYTRFDYKGQDIVVHDTGKVTVIEKIEPENYEDWECESGVLKLKAGTTYKENGSYDTLIIPNYWHGSRIREIAEDSYGELTQQQNIKLNRLIVSDGIEIINKCFCNVGLKEIYLSNTLEEVAYGVIGGSITIENIIIPKSVNVIGEYGISARKIYCEIKEKEKPTGWHKNWNCGVTNIIWGYGQ